MVSVGSFFCCGMCWTEQESTEDEMREESESSLALTQTCAIGAVGTQVGKV